MWPAERARELERKLLALAGKATLRFTFHHTIGEKMPYFPEQLEAELASLSGGEFQFVPPAPQFKANLPVFRPMPSP
jgi:hypothetical protein